jgi:hypothetical protein
MAGYGEAVEGSEAERQVRPSVEIQYEFTVALVDELVLDSDASRAWSLMRQTLMSTSSPEVVPDRLSRDQVVPSADDHRAPVTLAEPPPQPAAFPRAAPAIT